MHKSVTILGSTGSIGTNTVDIIKRNPEQFPVEALTANGNISLLAEQARLLKPKFVATADESKYKELKDALAGEDIKVGAGYKAVIEAAEYPADWTMSSIVGAAGLEPTLAAIKRGKTIGLANKETLVCAGDIVLKEIEDSGAILVPVDSEHSAIFQVFEERERDNIEKIILTASGGPFREASIEHMKKVTPEEAVAHPNWSMGAKISVDSATMMNKGLELIEAYYLFKMPEEEIEIMVHPQSVIHSMVAYKDGSVLAQLGSPDMRTPIAYALSYPNRMNSPADKLDLSRFAALTFEKPDYNRFPSLKLAREALKLGGSVPTIMNAANEIAVSAFLERQIGFIEIVKCVEKTIDKMQNTAMKTLTDVLHIDAEARKTAKELIAANNTI